MAVILATTAVSAHATTFLATLTGTVTSQDDAGSNPNIAVGDIVTISSQFDSSRIFDDGTLRAAALYGLPTSGAQFWKLTLNNLVWQTSDDEFDGAPFDFDADGHPLSFPYLDLNPDGTIAPHFLLTRVNATDSPRFYSNGGPTGSILPGDFLYGNTTPTPRFTVTWNLADSKFTAVPEPTMWLMMAAGFGLVGMAVRRRHSRLKATVC